MGAAIGGVGQPGSESGGEFRTNSLHQPTATDSVCVEVFLLKLEGRRDSLLLHCREEFQAGLEGIEMVE